MHIRFFEPEKVFNSTLKYSFLTVFTKRNILQARMVFKKRENIRQKTRHLKLISIT